MTDKYVILSRPNCHWCARAKSLILSTGADYEEFDILEKYPLREFLIANGVTTVPQIFLDGEWIGGYEDLQAWVGIDDNADH